jgi:hypothetical protein
MKKPVALVLTLFLFLSPNLAKTKPTDQVLLSHKHSEWKTRTATKNVLVHVVSRANRRLLIIDDLNDDDSDDPPGPNELDLQSPYARPRVEHKSKDLNIDDDLSEYVQIRLIVARAKAMKRYREIWT